MKYIWMLSISVLSLLGCVSSSAEDADVNTSPVETKRFTRFNGKYATTFNDLPDLHNSAAAIRGVGPLEARADTVLYEDQIVRIPQELEIYRVDKLTHSMPFLVPEAATLLSDIGMNFRDSLISKKMPIYRLIVTSVMRTDEDVKSLSRRNRNASGGSVHRYGTTFDIAWTRFDKMNPADERTLDDGRLKAVLGQVLHDLRQRDRCYIKHERKQSCFHITVR